MDRRERSASFSKPRRRTIEAIALVVMLSVSACLPASQSVEPAGDAAVPDSVAALPADEVRTIRAPRDLAAGDPLLQTAWEAWLRMELGRLETGSYTTDVLLDLVLPAGVRWTVMAYGPDAYALAVTGDGEPTGLRVDPDGVRVAR